MDLSTAELKSVKFYYDTIILPPPFCHRYEIECSIKPNSVEVKLELEYYNRDTIDEDDIFNEGFSLEDDHQWKGELNKGWKAVILSKFSKATWRKKIEISDVPPGWFNLQNTECRWDQSRIKSRSAQLLGRFLTRDHSGYF